MVKIIALNWKLNPGTRKEALALARLSDERNVMLFVPSVFLRDVAGSVKRAALGVQNIFWETHGAFTGEISASMAKSAGAAWTLVGHSERRKYFGETDEEVAKKIRAGIRAGLKIVLCVGEPWSVRKKGIASARSFVKNQLEKDLSDIKNFKLKIKNLVVAYEPVWAIGTGKSDAPEESAVMALFIKEILNAKCQTPNAKVLYGGSVNSKNIADFLNLKGIDGVLIGGASVKREELKRTLRHVS